jgi:hypothetical protein
MTNMSPQSIRIIKEARALFWPWVAVMVVALSRPFVSALSFNLRFEDLGIAGFCLGLPFLAALPFGNEFQYRTASQLLSQPVSRLQIWREKLIVMLVAVVSVSLAFFLTWPILSADIIQWVIAAAFLVATIGSSTFWALIARSTIGGLILNVAVQGMIVQFWAGFAQAAAARRHVTADAFPFLIAGAAGTVCYAGAMLWLGSRQLAKFQVTGDTSSQDLMSVRRLMPESVAQWFRSQPAGPTLNLIRKEAHLLRPVWLLTLLALAFLLCVAPLRLFSFPGRDAIIADAGVLVVSMFLLMASVLTGSLSMGEERQLGTHSWHLMLPVSVRVQWVIKVVSNMLAIAACGYLVLRTADFLLGPVFQTGFRGLLNNSEPSVLLFCMLSLTLPAFWCACAVNGTVRAAAWTVPVVAIFMFSPAFGNLLGRFGESDSSAVIHRIVLSAHALPVSNIQLLNLFDPGPVLFIGPGLVFAVFQSYYLFRVERPDGIRAVVQPLIPVCLVAFLCALPSGLVRTYVFELESQQFTVVKEVGRAVSQLSLDPAKLDAAHPLPISSQELNRVSPLSEVTQTWLRDATVSVSPKPEPTGHPFRFRFFQNGEWHESKAQITANIQFANGLECRAYDVFMNCGRPGELRGWFPILLRPTLRGR